MTQMERVAPAVDRELAGQVLRYGLTGMALAALYAAIYGLLATRLGLPAQAAIACGFAVTLVVGYELHSRWSFRGHGQREAGWSWGKFLAVNFAGYLLNCLWVWLIVGQLGRPVVQSIIPIVMLTPVFTFILNRRWTFA